VGADGAIYFVANSRLGTTLFRYNIDTSVERVSVGDNIIDAKLVSENEVFLAATSSDNYYYCFAPLKPSKQTPFETTLFFEKDPIYGSVSGQRAEAAPALDLTHPYHSLLEMHYSGTNLFLGNDVDAGWLYDLQINFADPLVQNALTGFVSRTNDEVTVAGLGYQNTQTFVRYAITGFGVTDKNDAVSAETYRDTGVGVQASLPWLQRGYWTGNLNASYQQDYASNEREPIGLTLSLFEKCKPRSETVLISPVEECTGDGGAFMTV
jgi:hypothetical protein